MRFDATRRLAHLLFVAMALTACGGGGGGGGNGAQGGDTGGTAQDTIVVTPATIRASFVGEGQDVSKLLLTSPGVEVTATFPSDPPSGELFVYVLQGEAVVSSVSLMEGNRGGRKSLWWVEFNPDLTPGDYQGELQVTVCAGAACAGPTWSATVPYQVTVKPGIVLTMEVNGLPVTGNVVKVRDDDLLTLSASAPVRWTRDWTSGANGIDVEETSDTWRATANYSISTPGATGSFSISALAEQLGAIATVVFEVTE